MLLIFVNLFVKKMLMQTGIQGFIRDDTIPRAGLKAPCTAVP